MSNVRPKDHLRHSLGAALKRLKTAKDKEERRGLGEVVRRAEAVFQGFFGLRQERTQAHKRQSPGGYPGLCL